MTDLPWSSGEQAGSTSNLQSLIAFSDSITKLVDERMGNLSGSLQSIGCSLLQNLYWENSIQSGLDMECCPLDLNGQFSANKK